MDNIKAFLEAAALLPCPFCGCSPLLNTRKQDGIEFHYIQCTFSACGSNPRTQTWRFEDSAIDQWNTRIAPDLAKMVEDMRVAKEALEKAAWAFDEVNVVDQRGIDWPRVREATKSREQAVERLKPYEKLFKKERER